MSFRVELEDKNGNTRDLVNNADQSIEGVNLNLEHTAHSQWDVQFHTDEYTTLESNWVLPTTDIFVYQDTTLLFRGFFERLEGSESDGSALAGGRDVMAKLNRGRVTKTYSNIRTWKAIEDYWANQTSFSATVTSPSPTEIVTDATAYDIDTNTEWSNNTSIANNEPFIVTNSELQLQQTCFTVEGENEDTDGSSIADVTNSNYSDGTAAAIENSGDFYEWNFTPQYTIPKEDFRVSMRHDNQGTSVPTWKFTLDGPDRSEETIIDGQNIAIGLDWSQFDSNDGNWTQPSKDLAAGTTYTLRIEVTTAGSDHFYIDVIAPNDKGGSRFTPNYTFDNNNGGSSGYLDGPELFPDATEITLSEFTNNTSNITEATASGTWDDTSGDQQIEFSNNGGTNYKAINNSESGTVSFSTTFGTTLIARLTLDRYGSRTTATPQTGFNGQQVDVFDATYDGSDLSVIDDATLRGSHFQNLKRLHNRANFRFTPNYKRNSLEVESYPRGTSGSDTWTVRERRRSKDMEGYANKVYVEGKQNDDGTYPTATLEDSAEVTNVGKTITITVKDTEITTTEGAKSRARKELNKRTQQDSIRGNITISPTYVKPGFRYTIDAWSENLDLESVSYNQAYNEANGSLAFQIDPVLAEQTVSQRADLDNTRNSL